MPAPISTVTRFFLELISYNTQSDYESASYPSTPSQLEFAEIVRGMCVSAGLTDAQTDTYGYVTATLAANTEKELPVIGLLAHMDTSSDAAGGPVKARIIEAYDGGGIPLNENLTLSPDEFPNLLKYTGQDLIVTGGDTLLGADDKAGIAEILAAMEYLIRHPEIKHGKIRIAFTPDEEVGRGVEHFDVKSFGADYAYTIDGGELGELEWETFNAARAVFHITGRSVHPGSAYKTMQNAALIAAEIINCFPKFETPAETRERQGFYHLTGLSGETGSAKLSFLLRDFDGPGLEKRKAFAKGIAARFNELYGNKTVELELRDEYRNMGEVLKDKPEIMERARRAMEKAGVTPLEKPVRGGTDGSRLSFMGLPCSNIFTGGQNGHGPYEYIPIPSMEAAVKVIVRLCEAEI